MFDPEKDLIDPLDYLILGELPIEGTLVLGLYPDGRTSRNLAENPLKGSLTNGQVGRRLASLHKYGLVVSVKAPASGGVALYQAAPLGKKLYELWADKASHVDQ